MFYISGLYKFKNIAHINKKKKFKKIKFNPKINYEFFSVKKTINLLF